MKKIIALIASLAVFAGVAVFTASASSPVVVSSYDTTVNYTFGGSSGSAQPSYYSKKMITYQSRTATQYVFNYTGKPDYADLNMQLNLPLPSNITSFTMDFYIYFSWGVSLPDPYLSAMVIPEELRRYCKVKLTSTGGAGWHVEIEASAIPLGVSFTEVYLYFDSGGSAAANWFNFTFTDFYFTFFDSAGQVIDAIVGGDGTPLAPEHNKDMDNKGNEMSGLENDALGGKSDEQIQQEVDSALSFDVDSLDSNATGSLATYFDGLLVVFGADYQSLLMLALSLGLAAFIIGRRYKTG